MPAIVEAAPFMPELPTGESVTLYTPCAEAAPAIITSAMTTIASLSPMCFILSSFMHSMGSYLQLVPLQGSVLRLNVDFYLF
jgi:hypothetical protein